MSAVSKLYRKEYNLKWVLFLGDWMDFFLLNNQLNKFFRTLLIKAILQRDSLEMLFSLHLLY